MEIPLKSSNVLFGELLDNSHATNPKIFELPRSVFESYEYIFAHPSTGAFMDMRDFIITKTSRSGPKAKNNLSDSAQVESMVNNQHPNDCNHCGKSSLEILPTSFLYSNTVKSTYPIIQKQRSELLKCDYCQLYWHMDCINPPLFSIPPQLQERNDEFLNLEDIIHVKSQLWGGESPLDPRLEFNTDVPNDHNEMNSIHMNMLNYSQIGCPILTFFKKIKIRRRWMCPCHADWIVPKQKLVPVLNNQLSYSRNNYGHSDLNNTINEESWIKYITCEGEMNIPNTKCSEIANLASTLALYSPVETIIPESSKKSLFELLKPTYHRGKLSIHSLLFSKFMEFDAHYTSPISTLQVNSSERNQNVIQFSDTVEKLIGTYQEEIINETRDVKLKRLIL
jgi:hypothetical protein